MSEARPGGPTERTKAALMEADAHPGHWVPVRADTKWRTVLPHYQETYPAYEFMWRQGELYVKSKREELA